MRRMVFSAGSRWLFAALVALPLLQSSLSGWAAAPEIPLASASIATGSSVAEVGSVLRQGQQLETQHRWSEALALYEDGVRQHPGDRDLQRRFDFTRLHYDLCRRYHDNSFRDAVLRLSMLDALDLYGDVLAKMQAHYVESPRWKELVERGTNDLEVALTEPAFVESTGLKADPRVVDEFRQELRQQLVRAWSPARPTPGSPRPTPPGWVSSGWAFRPPRWCWSTCVGPPIRWTSIPATSRRTS